MRLSCITCLKSGLRKITDREKVVVCLFVGACVSVLLQVFVYLFMYVCLRFFERLCHFLSVIVYVCVFALVFLCLLVSACFLMRALVYACLFVCLTCVCECMCVCLCVCVCVCVCLCVYLQKLLNAFLGLHQVGQFTVADRRAESLSMVTINIAEHQYNKNNGSLYLNASLCHVHAPDMPPISRSFFTSISLLLISNSFFPSLFLSRSLFACSSKLVFFKFYPLAFYTTYILKCSIISYIITSADLPINVGGGTHLINSY